MADKIYVNKLIDYITAWELSFVNKNNHFVCLIGLFHKNMEQN